MLRALYLPDLCMIYWNGMLYPAWQFPFNIRLLSVTVVDHMTYCSVLPFIFVSISFNNYLSSPEINYKDLDGIGVLTDM